MNITEEFKQEISQALGQKHVSDKTAQDLYLICKSGLTAREALELRGMNNPTPKTVYNLERKSKKCLLASPEMQKLAHNVTKRAMQGKPIIGKYKDKDGKDCENVMLPEFKHALAAASMVTDRTEPLRQEHNNGINTANIQVNIQELFIGSEPQHIAHSKPIGIMSEPESI